MKLQNENSKRQSYKHNLKYLQKQHIKHMDIVDYLKMESDKRKRKEQYEQYKDMAIINEHMKQYIKQHDKQTWEVCELKIRVEYTDVEEEIPENESHPIDLSKQLETITIKVPRNCILDRFYIR